MNNDGHAQPTSFLTVHSVRRQSDGFWKVSRSGGAIRSNKPVYPIEQSRMKTNPVDRSDLKWMGTKNGMREPKKIYSGSPKISP